MVSRRKVALFLLVTLSLIIVAGCSDPRPILRLPAPTPIPAKTQPTATLVPALAQAQKAAQKTAGAPAGGGKLPAPTQPPDASKGATVFQKNCVACHGKDGKGAIPGTPDFTSADFSHKAIPGQLFISISKGKGAMPAWEGKLSEQERWDVLFYELDFAVTNKQVAHGKQIFTQKCAVCHGQDGKGKIKGTPDFTAPAFWSDRSMADLFKVVTNGKGGMPPWKSQLSEQDRWDVLAYIRTFGYHSVHTP